MRIVRWVLGVTVGLAAVIAAALLWIVIRYPQVGPAPSLTLTTTPATLARGAYLFRSVAACASCHSQRDEHLPGAPVQPGTEGCGGERFGPQDGIPGTLTAPNLTPAALASWSDGEIWRALVCGVDRKGHALFPLMPYLNYAQLSGDDLAAIIGFLRTLPAIDHPVAAQDLRFPMNLMVRTIPRNAVPPASGPPAGDPVARGHYLLNAAACGACHSPMVHGRIVPGQEFSGGRAFHREGRVVRSANLTPDQATGIGSWTRERFIARFTTGPEQGTADLGYHSPMPWRAYAGMTGEDLGALFDYLRTVPSVRKAVMKVADDTAGPQVAE